MIELLTIGMRQAGDALSRLLGREVRVETPHLRSLPDEQPQEAVEVVGIHLGISGNLDGGILIAFTGPDARDMLKILLPQDAEVSGPLSELESSALLEIGNIMASACLNAVSVMLKSPLLPTVPRLVSGDLTVLLTDTAGTGTRGADTVIEAGFTISGSTCCGSFFFIPAPEAA